MSSKYIIHGATYCGDGTASNEAVSAGAPGAWNDLWSLLEGNAPAEGALSADDAIHIRAKDSSGAALEKTYSSAQAIGSTSSVSWILDDGTIWAGVTGTLTINSNTTSAQYALDLRANNVLSGSNGQKNVILNFSGTAHSTYCYRQNAGSCLSNATVNSSFTGTYGFRCLVNGPRPFVNVKIDTAYLQSNVSMINCTGGSLAIRGLSVSVDSAGSNCWIIEPTYNETLMWLGGVISGAAMSSTGPAITNSTLYAPFRIFGVRYPYGVRLCKAVGLTYKIRSEVYALGVDNKAGWENWTYNAIFESRDSGHFPVLNAQMKLSSAVGMAVRVYPHRPEEGYPASFNIQTLWSQAAASKTLTVEFLSATGLDAPTEDNTWVDISYINDSGEQVLLSSRAPGSSTAITSSSAAWSTTDTGSGITSYGSAELDRYKIALTTPDNIQQDSVIQVIFNTLITSNDPVNKVMFVCPAVQFS